MRHINYQVLGAAEGELLVMSEKLRFLQTEAGEIVKKIGIIASQECGVSDDQEALTQLESSQLQEYRKKVDELQDIIELLALESIALRKGSECLRKVINIYKRAEENVLDIYTGEYQVLPRTKFGTSHFETLNELGELIPVSTEALPDDTAFNGQNLGKKFSDDSVSEAIEAPQIIADDLLL